MSKLYQQQPFLGVPRIDEGYYTKATEAFGESNSDIDETVRETVEPLIGKTSSGNSWNTAVLEDAKASLRVQPRWLKYSRQVLRFFGTFSTKLEETSKEKSITRYVILHFYLEDGTVQISEPEIDNSGIVQGLYLKRHRIPWDETRYLGLNDIKLGVPTKIYGEEFIFSDCDKFTRDFCDTHGYDIGKSSPIKKPSDHKKIDPRALESLSEWKQYITIRQGGARKNALLEQYLKHDRMILRFYAILKKDPSEVVYNCIIQFFLAEDTVQIMQGRSTDEIDENKVLVRKQKPSRTYSISACPGLVTRPPEYLKAQDFIVGKEITIFDRTYFLRDCDEFTRNYFYKHLGIEQPDAIEAKPKRTLNIFGQFQVDPTPHEVTNEKSQSILNARAFLFGTDTRLVFDAVIHLADEYDAPRRFKILVHTSDNDITVKELRRKNSGRVEGTFATAGKKYNPKTGNAYTYQDFYVGSILVIYAKSFKIIGFDASTLQYMLANPSKFNKIHTKRLLKTCKPLFEKLKAEQVATEDRSNFIEVLRSADQANELNEADCALLEAVQSAKFEIRNEDLCELKFLIDSLTSS